MSKSGPSGQNILNSLKAFFDYNSQFKFKSMPANIEWTKLKQTGDCPGGRSGHTLTYFAANQYMLYGGIEDAKNGKINPNGDVYIMKLQGKDMGEAKWTKETVNGDDKPLARSQHVALYRKDLMTGIFVFGGHHDPKTRLNDTWFYDFKAAEWRRVGDEKDNKNNQESTIGAPNPRANCGACVYNGKVWLFGGHGGVGYQRTCFNDLFCFDLATQKWEQMVPNGNLPEGRGGHSLFASNNKIYIYGGWNSEKQFNNVLQFDLEKMEWSDPDIYNEIHRWNHCSMLIEAIPTWKFFIFGGECAEFMEGTDRVFGQYVNSSCYLDLGTNRWTTYASDPNEFANIPAPREYCSMSYDSDYIQQSKLIIFGGWNNGWYNDLYCLNVSKIVGPAYAVTKAEPNLGQLSGKTTINLTGQGFQQYGNPRVLFTYGTAPVDKTGGKFTHEVAGNWISETEMTCETPNLNQFYHQEIECIVQVQMGGGDLSTTWIPFTFFLNTRAGRSLAYGPGLLQDIAVGHPVEFVIQARNEKCENRTSGRDNFKVKIVKLNPAVAATVKQEEDGSCTWDRDAVAAQKDGDMIDCHIEDNHDGTYSCKYTNDDETPCKVEIYFENTENGEMEHVRGTPFVSTFNSKTKAADNLMTGQIMNKYIQKELERVTNKLLEEKKQCRKDDKDMKDVKVLLSVKEATENVMLKNNEWQLEIDQLDEALKLFNSHRLSKESQNKAFNQITKHWVELQKLAKDVKKEIEKDVNSEKDKNNTNINNLEDDINTYNNELKKREFFQYKCGTKVALEKLDGVLEEVKQFEDKIADLGDNAVKFGNPEKIQGAIKTVDIIKQNVDNMKVLWDHINVCQTRFKEFENQKWLKIEPFEMDDEVKKLQKTLKEFKPETKKCDAYKGIFEDIKKWLQFIPLITDLSDKDMRERHWTDLKKRINAQFTIDDNFLLKNIADLNLIKYAEDVDEICDQARQEAKMEKTLEKLQATWKDIEFDFQPHKDSGVHMMKLGDDNFDLLEADQQSVSAMFSSRYLSTFEKQINHWNLALSSCAEILQVVADVQRSWSFLENLFIHSDEVKKELPRESQQFVGIDKNVRDILAEGFRMKKAIDFSLQGHVLKVLENCNLELKQCEKALNEFMDTKRMAFPRFFFVSPADLLDILSNGNNPPKIMVHMSKIFQAIDNLELKEFGNDRPAACAMITGVGKETVKFHEEMKLMGKVEIYLEDIIQLMRNTLRKVSINSLTNYNPADKAAWIKREPSQVCLLINVCQWVIMVEKGFQQYAGNKNAIKECFKKQDEDLRNLIIMVQGDLDKSTRTKVMTLITMDAHSRDIIEKLDMEGVTRQDEFQWQTQLKGTYNGSKNDFEFKIADACLAYGYEYLGNGPRLVITPLTDRIYVTATQALHLKMGCAPAGPAGTGKTETTKDLANALGKACYVFNCSDQMDYMGMAGIFKGLAASGSWGCFDEFNRLVPEVLSVCSVQFKAVTDAVKSGAKKFFIQDVEVSLDPTCGAFITMNPGYLGRSELPEGLKALFRPITVVVPDLQLICENMLMAEGFVEAKILAKKFVRLYFLCRDLLSKAMHYDWGLRAIKSVLVVAGGFKRAEPTLQEKAILLRALRDFNIPKIVAEDNDIFFGLLGDLFPAIEVSRKRDMKFEGIIEKAATENGLNPDKNFVLKTVQLSELLEIRHCVFVMGPPCSGKSETWKTLANANDKNDNKTTWKDINPKVTSTNELYGVVLLATREWKDGLLSQTMRDLGKIEDTKPKWIILDGDLDANWIESMNSVMDDNKLLTLASNERIPLKPHMRMIFEIRDLRFATPATVSRAGILYISDSEGFQWRSYVTSWIKRNKFKEDDKKMLQEMFDTHMEKIFNQINGFSHIINQQHMQIVMCICKLLENLMNTNNVTAVQKVFIFACIWCVGGGYSEKDGVDYKKLFGGFFKEYIKSMNFIKGKGSVFDYYLDFATSNFEEWNKISPPEQQIDTSKAIPSYTIPTPDTIAFSYLMKQFINIQHSPLLVGMAGCGKTQMIKGCLNEICASGDVYMQQTINFNFYTDANLLQLNLEQFLEKKAGIRYAPLMHYKLIWFIDDMNMPMRDPYDTQTAISMLRQHKDYEHWYDKQKQPIQMKKVEKTQMIAAMNPTAGSFVVDPRLQRHFWVLAVGMPENSSLTIIYSAYLNKHFSKFNANVSTEIPSVIKNTLTLHQEVVRLFKKTAANFHYEFNVRHLTNVFQGLLTAKVESIKTPEMFIKLWVHESERVYGDRLVSYDDLFKYRAAVQDLVGKNFTKYQSSLKKYTNPDKPEPLIFANFVGGLDEKLYDQFQSTDDLTHRLQEALREYNDLNAVMDLVLFEDAMKHVCKISRIISASQGHALLVGVGGSGKQSLSRLASFICAFATTGIVISSSYGISDLKNDLQVMYKKTGLKNEGVMFLFTEGQITNEKFLVYLNDLLSSGEIADLFTLEDVDMVVNTVRPAVKGEGIVDNKDNCWKFFIDRVKQNLHMSLCFSPGESFRNRAKKFPALVNCTVIDWFHPWPDQALLSVAQKFLAEIEMADDVRTGIEKFMPFSFKTVGVYSKKILLEERRFVYTTPKSFLELIKLFTVMYKKKFNELEENKDKYELGVMKLTSTGEVVSKLEEELKIFSVEVEKKKKEADEQAEIVGAEKVIVEVKTSAAEKEAAICAEIKNNVEAKMASVQKDLDAALPLVEKAQKALQGLKVDDFRNLKALKTPPEMIAHTFTCVLHLLCGVNEFASVQVPVDKNGKLKTENPWKTALGVMGNPKELLEALNSLKGYIDAQKLKESNFKYAKSWVGNEEFTPEKLKTKSECASGLCDFVINIVQYYDVVESVEPKRNAVREAEEQLNAANSKKAVVDAEVAELNARLNSLMIAFDKAMREKQQALDEAARCERKLDLANRLVNALGSEQERWKQSIEDLAEYIKVLIGDVLMSSAFVSYVGPFNKPFRIKIMAEFAKFFTDNKIPASANCDPVKILTDEATIAGWNQNKLPSDQVSTENGCILTSSERYSLIIDPQLQGITWLRKTWDPKGLVVTRLTNPKMVKEIEIGVEQGTPTMIENIENTIDAIIQPVYARAIIKKGKMMKIKMGDKELDLNPNFKLFLHTKLSNPHYQPEIQAECALINFTVTEAGLEDQLLALVVKKERPDLSEQSELLIQQQNEFKIKLGQLEKNLLKMLAEAEGDILENITLIESLEESKRLSVEISEKVEIAKETQINISEASEKYRPAANRGALVFFLMNELYKIHSFYKFSLDSFVIVVERAIDLVAAKMNPKKKEKTAPAEGEEAQEEEEEEEEQEISPEQLTKRVEALTESITFQGFNYTRRGTLEVDKMIIATMLCFRILERKGEIPSKEINALIKKEIPAELAPIPENLKYLPESVWGACKGLEQLDCFEKLTSWMESEALNWKKWYGEQEPENGEQLPKSVRDVSLFHRILLLRAIRPDRMLNALKQFIREKMGEEYVEQPAFDMAQCYTEMNIRTPIFFVLFPGVDPTPDVEKIGKENNKAITENTFINISMGQGQEKYAIKCLHEAGEKGNWVMFQNVHLMQTWMKQFERELEIVLEKGAHPEFRCFVSSEPPALPEFEIIPEAILQNSLKVANEAPTDLKSNIRRAYAKFDQSHFEKAKSHKLPEFKALLMGLIMYHSLILGRRKFGFQGWSRKYNFNDGDLRICGDILHNYLTSYKDIPYADLQYLYGEIMYGGHITDGWDRRTNSTYLKVLIKPEIMNAMPMTCTVAGGFRSPDPNKFERQNYIDYVETKLPPENPAMFGMHANAEIGYLTNTGENLFRTILQCSGGGGSGGGNKDEKVKALIEFFLNNLPEFYNMFQLNQNLKNNKEKNTPFTIVSFQEAERMNTLLGVIKKSLVELQDGLAGKLNMTDDMEQLANKLFLNMQPDLWIKNGYPSLKSLNDWYSDLLLRCKQLNQWTEELTTPNSLWISGLFNPMSFITAIMQVTSRETGQALDDMTIQTDVLNVRNPDDIKEGATNGKYIHGFFLEGAKWEDRRGSEQGCLADMDLKDLHPALPVMHVLAVPKIGDALEVPGRYRCPIYLTSIRGAVFVCEAYLNLGNDEESEVEKLRNQWILSGVCLIMAPE